MQIVVNVQYFLLLVIFNIWHSADSYGVDVSFPIHYGINARTEAVKHIFFFFLKSDKG